MAHSVVPISSRMLLIYDYNADVVYATRCSHGWEAFSLTWHRPLSAAPTHTKASRRKMIKESLKQTRAINLFQFAQTTAMGKTANCRLNRIFPTADTWLHFNPITPSFICFQLMISIRHCRAIAQQQCSCDSRTSKSQVQERRTSERKSIITSGILASESWLHALHAMELNYYDYDKIDVHFMFTSL